MARVRPRGPLKPPPSGQDWGWGWGLGLGSELGLGLELVWLTEAAALGLGVGERLHLNWLEAVRRRQPMVVG